MNPQQLAVALGGEVVGRNSVNAPGPGHTKADRSLSVMMRDGNFIVFSHAGDHWKDCRDHVAKLLGLEQWRPERSAPRGKVMFLTSGSQDKERDDRKQFALKIWDQSVSATGTLVETYLRDARGLSLPADPDAVVRYHARLKHDAEYYPGMICLFRDVMTDEPCGIHRTFLTPAGEKIDRRMLGVAKGAAIKIDRHVGIKGTLTVGEGFETTLAANLAGLGPVWALGSSGAVGSFPVLPDLAELTLLEENDPTSRREVKTCVRRYLGAGKPVNVVTPNVGKDFNDAWKAATA